MAIQLPAYLKPANPKFLDKLTGGIGGAQPPTISRKNNRFTLIGANGEPVGTMQPALSLDVIIVGGNDHPSKVFYEGDYDPNDAAAPDCFSDNGIGPSSQSAKPQNDLCSTCPQAVWGSKISRMSGKKIQACATYKKVAVVVCGDSSGTVYLLAIPPASLKIWLAYMNHLGGQGIDPSQVITRLTFGDDMLGVLNFQETEFIPENFVAPIEKIIASEEPDIVTGNRDKPIITQKALPPGGGSMVQQIPAQANFGNQTAAAPDRGLGDTLPPQQPAPLSPPEPKKRGPKPKALHEETVVTGGPIPEGTFTKPAAPAGESVEELEAKLAAMKAKKTGGIMPFAPPPSSEIQKLLSDAFQLPVRDK